MDIPQFPANTTRAIFPLSLIIIGWLVIIYIESSQQPAEFLGLIPQLDKAAHFAAFTILGLLICALSFKLSQKPSIPLFSMPLLVATLCGLIEEGLQTYVPGRTASIPDLLADVSGAIFAILLANFWVKKLKK